MAQGFDLATTFVHLADGGGAEPLKPTPSFWRGSGRRYDVFINSRTGIQGRPCEARERNRST